MGILDANIKNPHLYKMKIILNIGTHGNEKIGLRVAKEINKLNIPSKTLEIQVANPKALELGKRFVESDLNRSFPGKKNGTYEERLALKLSKKIKSADIVIDIHSTTSSLRDAIIVTKLDKKTLSYVKAIEPKYVLIMGVTKNIALISQAKIGLAFEYGKDNDAQAINKTVTGVKRILNQAGIITGKGSTKNSVINYFRVTKSLKKIKGYKLLKSIKNYRMVQAGEPYATNGKEYLITKEDFYPILFGEKNYKDIYGFIGKRV